MTVNRSRNLFFFTSLPRGNSPVLKLNFVRRHRVVVMTTQLARDVCWAKVFGFHR